MQFRWNLLNLRPLEAFPTTMHQSSITDAAKLLHISRPSVIHLIEDFVESTVISGLAGEPIFNVATRAMPTVFAMTFEYYRLPLCH